MSTTQNNQPEKRAQTPEDTMARIAGVPRTPEEAQAERETLELERQQEAQRRAGVVPPQQTPAPTPKTSSHSQPTQPTTRTTSSDKA